MKTSRRRHSSTRCLVHALATLLAALLPSLALAATPGSIAARLHRGYVEVGGTAGVPHAVIRGEGSAVRQAERSGAFRFVTRMLPSDCVGLLLSDGVPAIETVVQSCGRRLPAARRGQVWPQGPPGAVPRSVYDARGQRVGEALTFVGGAGAPGSSALVVVAVGEYSLPLTLTADGAALSSGLVWFPDSRHCTGPAFVDPPAGRLAPREYAAVGPPGRTVYAPDANATPRTAPFAGSFFSERYGCHETNDARALVPAVPVGDLRALGFTSPFSVR